MPRRYQPRKKSGDPEPLMEWFVKDRMRPDPRVEADVSARAPPSSSMRTKPTRTPTP